MNAGEYRDRRPRHGPRRCSRRRLRRQGLSRREAPAPGRGIWRPQDRHPRQPRRDADDLRRLEQGELADPLLGAAADVLGLRDSDGVPLLEKVLDVSRGPELCGPAASLALELGVPAPLASQAAFSSFLSRMKDERVDASAVLSGPKVAPTGDRHAMIEELRKALHAAFILAYAEAYSPPGRRGAGEGGASSRGGLLRCRPGRRSPIPLRAQGESPSRREGEILARSYTSQP